MDTKGTAKKKDNDDFPLEFPIEVPEDPLRAPLPEPIGKIRVGDHHYDMLEIIFSSQGLVGRGHWVLGGEKEAMNEVNMMRKMNGVRGVPKLVEHWIVESRNKIDQTANYRCARRPLHQFRTRLELLSSIRRYREDSEGCGGRAQYSPPRTVVLNNAMIEDDGKDHTWDADRLGGSPMSRAHYHSMSRALLLQLHLCDPDGADERKKASDSKPNPAPLIKHTYHDDLESMFLHLHLDRIEFRGPLGHETYSQARSRLDTGPMVRGQVSNCAVMPKHILLAHGALRQGTYRAVHPYFKKLLPVALEWYHLMREPSRVTFNDIIGMLERHITILPIDEPSPELLVSQWLLKGLNAEGSGSGGEEGESQSPIRETAVPRTRLNNKRLGVTDYRWTMEMAPKAKGVRLDRGV
ncbi:hypothetical protein DEU56DRAFT_761089 [Suillus clintonianus]|uniref:uncharacterized protein n=1 Tax=Suillus clintonianus TaxID=1904413 RepID=UPI001B87DAC4|nr:uncharacterized protein DEU56DRAFT_761089 [Suillus clintonianus]KAG2119177.1 hypothetical protein DEU56DRAFT_761089 [Suillus clintonianus]